MTSRKLAVLALLFLVVAVSSSFAGDAKAPITGLVTITEDADWNITAVKLTTADKTVYQVVLDEMGKRLGNEEDGQRAEVRGALAEKDGVKWLTVSDFKELQ